MITLENESVLKIGRLEDKIALYEPTLKSLQGVLSVPNEIDKICVELGTLRESRVEMRERLTTLSKAQTKVVESYNDRLTAVEKVIESFKLKGWELLFRIIPWVIAAATTGWAISQSS